MSSANSYVMTTGGSYQVSGLYVVSATSILAMVFGTINSIANTVGLASIDVSTNLLAKISSVLPY